ncbi:hypothetical protein M758_4G221200 [Ceratodon purpureus]|nr:hypothetical protein M758_4G221200 [Ceratodon purpureus]
MKDYSVPVCSFPLKTQYIPSNDALCQALERYLIVFPEAIPVIPEPVDLFALNVAPNFMSPQGRIIKETAGKHIRFQTQRTFKP